MKTGSVRVSRRVHERASVSGIWKYAAGFGSWILWLIRWHRGVAALRVLPSTRPTPPLLLSDTSDTKRCAVCAGDTMRRVPRGSCMVGDGRVESFTRCLQALHRIQNPGPGNNAQERCSLPGKR